VAEFLAAPAHQRKEPHRNVARTDTGKRQEVVQIQRGSSLGVPREARAPPAELSRPVDLVYRNLQLTSVGGDATWRVFSSPDPRPDWA
jgi:hypothetical protein